MKHQSTLLILFGFTTIVFAALWIFSVGSGKHAERYKNFEKEQKRLEAEAIAIGKKKDSLELNIATLTQQLTNKDAVIEDLNTQIVKAKADYNATRATLATIVAQRDNIKAAIENIKSARPNTGDTLLNNLKKQLDRK